MTTYDLLAAIECLESFIRKHFYTKIPGQLLVSKNKKNFMQNILRMQGKLIYV